MTGYRSCCYVSDGFLLAQSQFFQEYALWLLVRGFWKKKGQVALNKLFADGFLTSFLAAAYVITLKSVVNADLASKF